MLGLFDEKSDSWRHLPLLKSLSSFEIFNQESRLSASTILKFVIEEKYYCILLFGRQAIYQNRLVKHKFIPKEV